MTFIYTSPTPLQVKSINPILINRCFPTNLFGRFRISFVVCQLVRQPESGVVYNSLDRQWWCVGGSDIKAEIHAFVKVSFPLFFFPPSRISWLYLSHYCQIKWIKHIIFHRTHRVYYLFIWMHFNMPAFAAFLQQVRHVRFGRSSHGLHILFFCTALFVCPPPVPSLTAKHVNGGWLEASWSNGQ